MNKTRMQRRKNPNKYQVPMVSKTLKILEVLSQAEGELSLTQIMHHAGVAKASAFRILRTLHSAGYVEKNEINGNYRLGIKILQLCHVVDKNRELRNLAMPFLLSLQQQFNESVNLAVLDNGEVLYLATVESTSALRMSGDMVRNQIHCTALGKALAAYTPWETVESILRLKGMPKKTEHTIVSRTEFKKELERIRQRGVAYDVEELESGAWCVAAPVFDFTGKVVAAISISAPLYRVLGREEEMAEAVRLTTQRFSAKLGYKPQAKAV